MKTYKSSELISTLASVIDLLLKKTTLMDAYTAEQLNAQPAAGKWSVAQVLEHLNAYNRYYLPEIEKAILKGMSANAPGNEVFKPGMLGNYFTKLMQPGKSGAIANKMQAPKGYRPAERQDAAEVVSEFKNGCKHLLSLLQKAHQVDIGSQTVPISISKFVKLKLGDVLRFVVAHKQRHFIQIENIISSLSMQGQQADATM
jgi:uncharacterized damage-inducible protein DinB